ncbi:hypothetical protein SAY87_008575 [Trapa incisa]|uniref:Uncharacterized protein n=1 Tax=Trapa incisa TaxID=236973 RepID=A0AAN7PWC7_9MYRT|nr:hypothetical protein SAY87_008575 [Trapa incisa]
MYSTFRRQIQRRFAPMINLSANISSLVITGFSYEHSTAPPRLKRDDGRRLRRKIRKQRRVYPTQTGNSKDRLYRPMD